MPFGFDPIGFKYLTKAKRSLKTPLGSSQTLGTCIFVLLLSILFVHCSKRQSRCWIFLFSLLYRSQFIPSLYSHSGSHKEEREASCHLREFREIFLCSVDRGQYTSLSEALLIARNYICRYYNCNNHSTHAALSVISPLSRGIVKYVIFST